MKKKFMKYVITVLTIAILGIVTNNIAYADVQMEPPDISDENTHYEEIGENGERIYTEVNSEGIYTEVNSMNKPTNISTRATAPSKPGKWIQESNGKWWYKHNDGTYTTNAWEKIDGKWYYFDSVGYMVTGWIKDEGEWYYCDSSGAMVTGWIKDGGNWYYCNSSGAMVTSWSIINNQAYYFDTTSGAMQLTVFTYKLNKHPNGSDAAAFLSGIKSKVPFRSIPYSKETVKNSGFYNNSEYIKYWSSHGWTSGKLAGDNTSAEVYIHSDRSNFNWSGNNLEFVFLAACNQLNGDTNRAKYANAMIGNDAVRVIAGYHEKAPGNKISSSDLPADDVYVAERFVAQVKSGASVKTAWMKANENNKNYCVLTHSGSAHEEARFNGFGKSNPARPQSSSKTIKRFTYANQGGIAQTLIPPESRAIKNDDFLFISTLPVLKKTNVKHVVHEDAEVMVFKYDNEIVTSVGEIDSTEVSFNEEEAVNLCKKWMDDTYKTADSSILNDKKVSTYPITAAEINLTGGEEVETIIGYTVKFENDFQDIRIIGDDYTVMLDNDGVEYAALRWNDYEIIEQDKTARSLNAISHEEAIDIVMDSEINKNHSSYRSVVDIDFVDFMVKSYELVYAFDDESSTYQPNWLLSMSDDSTYTVNVFSGRIK